MRRYGVGFPVKEKAPQGNLEFKGGQELIRDSLIQILGTAPCERRKVPTFGCYLPPFLFKSLTDANKRLLAWKILDAIERWERDVDVRSIELVQSKAEQGEGIVKVMIHLVDLTTGEDHNLSVFLSSQGVIYR